MKQMNRRKIDGINPLEKKYKKGRKKGRKKENNKRDEK
jgi:hypothetical protein